MSDTPRTDAEFLRILNDPETPLNYEIYRMSFFAQQLERELNAAKAALHQAQTTLRLVILDGTSSFDTMLAVNQTQSTINTNLP